MSETTPAPQRTEETEIEEAIEAFGRAMHAGHGEQAAYNALRAAIRALRSPAPAESAAPERERQRRDECCQLTSEGYVCSLPKGHNGWHAHSFVRPAPASPPPVAREADSMRRIVLELMTGGRSAVMHLPDHACASCLPHGGPMVVDGFRCLYHLALDVAHEEALSLARESAKESK